MGNDVVDLGDPANIGKSGDKRFCRRVFNASELAQIAGSSKPDTILWAIWGAKEAAYKAISRGAPSVCSIPQRYPVTLEISSERKAFPIKGTVNTPLGDLFVHIFVGNDVLHVLAAGTPKELTRVVFRLASVVGAGEDTSIQARKILQEEIAGFLDCPVDELSILKEEQRPWAPYVTRRGFRLFAGISLSHDGRFVAVAFDPAEFLPFFSSSPR